MIFTPNNIQGLELKNRSIRAGCFEGMCQNGQVTDNLIEHHRAVAAGGVAMTTVAYCSVNFEGRAFDHELWMRDEVIPDLKRLTDAVHKEGAKASIQLGHCGFFTNKSVIQKQPMGASPKWCMFMLSKCRSMTTDDIERTTDDFVRAALEAKKAGFDAVEIHGGHGYLLSQFLSPWTNKRTDGYGGSLENRMRFPLNVVRKVREALGDDFPILVKINQTDGMKEGIQLTDAIQFAKALEQAGASALIPSCGFTSKVPFLMLRGNLPVKEMAKNQQSTMKKIGLKLFGKFMVPKHEYNHLFQFEGAQKIQAAIQIPVIYIGGVESKDDMDTVLSAGIPFFQIGRATIQDSEFMNKIASGEISKSACDHCNRCVAAMDGGGVYCVSNKLGYLQ
ncbi:MAG: NADH:flavin oxidoreductase [Crocinitomicaceae bacterium]|nr:NADH:flavin oxidoreductase [Crocinitomicaceae bacterium]